MRKMWYARKKLVKALKELEDQTEIFAQLSESDPVRKQWELSKADTLIVIGLIDVFVSRKEQTINDVMKSKL